MKQVSPEGLKWFQDSRFGMFIHWGLYSILARGEWVMHNEKIPVPEYEPLVQQFNPVKFNADEWVRIAADAGQKYIVITSRHHDGFSMYDTALSDYKVTNTPFGRDPLRELADACARRGDIRLGFYSSLLDWHHPAYRFRKESGLAWDDYLEFLHGQVRELCTQFGRIACIWFDGDWPNHLLNDDNAYFAAGGSFEYEKLYEMIHTLQPDAVVHNNRHAEPLPGEDVQGFEQDLPGQNTASFNTTQIFGLPMEVCMTINDSWGVNKQDENHKSTQQLVRTLVRAASAGANYLLNVGPTALGEILPVHAERLRAMGQWLAIHGDSIYGTQAGIIAPASNGSTVSTRRDEVHYVHALQYISDCVMLRGVPVDVTRASLLKDGSPITFGTRAEDTVLTILPQQRDLMDTVIRLEK
ncbi:MAG TPA: alpha-L-fucosidase [Anaerolineales bacterium]|nr:alpha-L-fucosidase [Anaerolineales bacterium]